MKLESLHIFFKKIGEFQLKYRWLLLILLTAISIFAAMGLKKFRATSMTEEVFVNITETMKKMKTGLKSFSAAMTP